MGCGASLHRVVNAKGKELDESKTDPLSKTEINDRTVQSDSEIALSIRDVLYDVEIDVRYAFCSQRGYYPHQLNKPNQDAYLCHNVLGDEDALLLGVFDGHGAEGDKCAQFAKSHLVQNLEQELRSALRKTNTTTNTHGTERGNTVSSFTTMKSFSYTQQQALKVIQAYDPLKSEEGSEVEKIFKDSFLQTNEQMHASEIRTSLSGTTAICVLMVGSTLIVGNVGDSRAVLVHAHPDYPDDPETVAVTPLSYDQTPYRSDERSRLKLYGARIMTVDQVEGREPLHENWGTRLGEEIDEYGDPPRVWNDSLEQPGCAFSRSLGDLNAEHLGVTANAEVMLHQLSATDKFIVIASDGVFEFITSQAVANMVNRTLLDGSGPLEACRRVVAEAYRLWLQYEIRSDDITIVCLCLDEYKIIAAASSEEQSKKNDTSRLKERKQAIQEAASSLGGTTADTNTVASAASASQQTSNQNSIDQQKREVRPVRRVLAKEKRLHLNLSEAHRLDPSEIAEFQANFDKYAVPKSLDDEQRIIRMTKSNFLFANLSAEKLAQLVAVMQKQYFEANDIIMRWGDEGDKFYLVESGAYDVRIRDAVNSIEHTIHSYRHSGEGFGELALMYGKPRSATIKCVQSGYTWSLSRLAFRAILMKPVPRENLIKTLAMVNGLETLTAPQLQRLCDAAQSVSCPAGTDIVRQGDMGDCFYVIYEGHCAVYKTMPDGTETEALLTLGTNAYFGERALLHNEPRAATVRAVDNVSLLKLTRSVFKEVSAGIKHSLQAEHQRRIDAERASISSVDSNAEQPFSAQEEKDDTPPLHRHFSIFSEPSRRRIASAIDDVDFTFQGPGVLNSESNSFIGVYVLTKQGFCDNRVVSVRLRALEPSAKDGGKGLLREREILREISHDSLIPRLIASQLDSLCARYVFDEIIIGDVHSLLENELSLQVVLYTVASVIEAISFLHERGLLVRSVNTESILVTDKGQTLLSDLSATTRPDTGRAYTLCGDALYLAPEMISGEGYTFPIDFWAVGVLAFEMFTAKPPFSGDAEAEIYAKIVAMRYEVPDHTPTELAQLFQALLVPESTRVSDAEIIRTHSAFATIDFDALRSRTLASPLLPLCQNSASKASQLETTFLEQIKPPPDSIFDQLAQF